MSKWWAAAYALVALVAVVRVASTHRVFSAVIDEPIHIAAGYEWWHGEPAWDALHPPLAKLLFGIPYRSAPKPAAHDRAGYAFDLLYGRADDIRGLAHARAANLLFLLIALAAVIAWGRRFGGGVALLAAAMFAAMPPILGHAGLATTDMAVAALLPVALLALDRWLAAQTWPNALLLGAAIGLGALSKYSFLLFFPVAAVVLFLFRRRRISIAQLIAALAAAIVVVWAGYQFTFAPLSTFRSVTMPPPETLSPALAWLYTHVPLPAPQFFGGMVILHYYNAAGRAAYLLGEVRQSGWWYYFPVLFFFKTPLPFQFLAFFGAIRRRGTDLAITTLALMASVFPSSINIGIRHILPLYPLLCVVAALGAAALWEKRRARIVAIAALGWLFAGTALAHPDYLAWFNEAAGRHPERIAVDSNLDWGQDMLRLARLARARKLDAVALDCVSAMPFERHGVATAPLPQSGAAAGWLAVSETRLALDSDARARVASLPQSYERIGRSIRLYRIESAGH